jgi:hypothetical protein
MNCGLHGGFRPELDISVIPILLMFVYVQGASGVSMQLDRRAAAQGIAAGILAVPAAAFAAAGDFPKVG